MDNHLHIADQSEALYFFVHGNDLNRIDQKGDKALSTAINEQAFIWSGCEPKETLSVKQFTDLNRGVNELRLKFHQFEKMEKNNIEVSKIFWMICATAVVAIYFATKGYIVATAIAPLAVGFAVFCAYGLNQEGTQMEKERTELIETFAKNIAPYAKQIKAIRHSFGNNSGNPIVVVEYLAKKGDINFNKQEELHEVAKVFRDAMQADSSAA